MVENSAHEGKEWSVGEQVLDGQGIPAIIAYVGETQFATGRWIGLIFDQPIGKNNGIVQGVKYFECEENHGRFVRENQVHKRH
jgi:dynactin complex subunit